MSDLLTTANDPAAVPILDSAPACEQCGSPFEPRKGSGGKPQKFCSRECKRDHHAADDANVSQSAQRETLGTASAAATAPKVENISPAATLEGEAEFDWCGSDPCIVLREQPSTAVYVNASDAVVIRQEKSWCDENDSFVCIRPEYAIAFAKRFLTAAGYPGIGFVRRVGGGFEDVE